MTDDTAAIKYSACSVGHKLVLTSSPAMLSRLADAAEAVAVRAGKGSPHHFNYILTQIFQHIPCCHLLPVGYLQSINTD